MKKKNIVLTGGAGYIGSHILLDLLRNNYDVVVLDNFSNSSPNVLENIRKNTNVNFNIVKGDVCEKDLVQCFKGQSESIVIHCAGLKSTFESQIYPVKYYSENVGGALNLLKVMEEYGCENILFSSSASVYGDTNQVPIDESCHPKPVSVYANTKLIVEQILNDWAKASIRRSCISLRYFNPVGADYSGLVGEVPGQKPSNLIPQIINVASGILKRIKIYGNDYDTRDGTGERDYVHVSDLSKAHLNALEYVMRNNGFQSVNIGTGKGITVLELIKKFEEINSVSVPYSFVGRRKGDLAKSFANVSMAYKLLGWESKYNLEDMCESAWLWHKNNI